MNARPVLGLALALGAVALGARAAGDAASAPGGDSALPVQGTLGNAGRPWPEPERPPAAYHHDPASIAAGKELFTRMNCAGCHGYDAKGAMGPNLTDDYWRYGGTPRQVHDSIASGRPQGMPAWGGALGDSAVWNLTAYILSLKAPADSATTNAAPSIDLPADIGQSAPAATAAASAPGQ